MNRNYLGRKIAVAILSFIVLGAVVVTSVHWFISSSDAFAVAERYVKTNDNLIDRAGKITSVKLSWFGEHSLEEQEINGKVNGNAVFTVLANGPLSSLPIRIWLARDEREWRVTEARIVQ